MLGKEKAQTCVNACYRQLKAFNPFPLFSIVLSDGIEEDREDAHVANYWATGYTLSLQLSCFRRDLV